MSRTTVERELKDEGFRFHRRATHGDLWTDGITTIMVSNTTLYRSDPDLRQMRKDIRMAKLKREQSKVPNGTLRAPLLDFVDVVPKAAPHPPIAPLETPKPKEEPMQPAKPLVIVKEEPVQQNQKSRVRKFTRYERLKLQDRMNEIRKEQRDHVKITLQLGREGFTMSNGDPLDPALIRSYIVDQQKVEDAAAAMHKAQLPLPVEPSSPPTVAPRTGRALPHWALSILTDPELEPRDKVDMLLAMVKP